MFIVKEFKWISAQSFKEKFFMDGFNPAIRVEVERVPSNEDLYTCRYTLEETNRPHSEYRLSRDIFDTQAEALLHFESIGGDYVVNFLDSIDYSILLRDTNKFAIINVLGVPKAIEVKPIRYDEVTVLCEDQNGIRMVVDKKMLFNSRAGIAKYFLTS